MNYLDILRVQLRTDEGTRVKPYRDTVGKLTIGIGRNLDDIGLHPDEISLLLENDIRGAEWTAKTVFNGFDALSDNRKAALVNMAFNLGETRLSGFHHLIAAINCENFPEAARQMLQSLWAQQVGARAKRLAVMIEGG